MRYQKNVIIVNSAHSPRLWIKHPTMGRRRIKEEQEYGDHCHRTNQQQRPSLIFTKMSKLFRERRTGSFGNQHIVVWGTQNQNENKNRPFRKLSQYLCPQQDVHPTRNSQDGKTLNQGQKSHRHSCIGLRCGPTGRLEQDKEHAEVNGFNEVCHSLHKSRRGHYSAGML